MYLKQLSLVNFKNYSTAEFDFSSHVNCFVGNNGEGKTNLLDAIHYLSFCKSFFNPVDSQNILHGAPFFVIQGTFVLRENIEEIYCGQKRNQKKQFKRAKKEYSRLAEHIGLLPLVMISPADSGLITDGSESRRRFMDSVMAQYDSTYLHTLICYNKILSQRNALLKQMGENGRFDRDSLEVWDLQLVEYGKNIYEKRSHFIAAFIPLFQKLYALISGEKEQVSIRYQSHLNEGDFALLLEQALPKDRALQYSSTGPHKDDLEFFMNDFTVKKFGSQGQQKSFLLALKLAQLDFIKGIKNISPILLLDDIYDKLDDKRVKQLMELVSNKSFGQIFITDTHPDRLAKLFQNTSTEFKLFRIKNSSLEN